MSSDAQMLAAGLLQLALGAALLSPASLLAFISPATLRIEGLTGLPPLVLGNGVEQALAVVGVLQFYLGYLYCMAVYTSDRRFTHNSTPGRVLLGAAAAYVCQKTPYGSSFIALLGIGNALSGVLMGLTIGFGDGNVVGLEEAEEKLRGSKKSE